MRTLAARRTNFCNADEADIGFPNFADAAFPRTCSGTRFEVQRNPPDRPLGGQSLVFPHHPFAARGFTNQAYQMLIRRPTT
jgi:hypothetical protein